MNKMPKYTTISIFWRGCFYYISKYTFFFTDTTLYNTAAILTINTAVIIDIMFVRCEG